MSLWELLPEDAQALPAAAAPEVEGCGCGGTGRRDADLLCLGCWRLAQAPIPVAPGEYIHCPEHGLIIPPGGRCANRGCGSRNFP